MATSSKINETDRLPRLPATPVRKRTRVTTFGGVVREGGGAWEIAEMKNLSPRRYPALATRHPREVLSPASGMATGHGMVVVDKDLYLVRNTTLFRVRDALRASRTGAYVESLGTLTDSDKTMVVFGDYLLIFPDKQYIRLSEGSLHPMEIDTGVLENVAFNGNCITLPDGQKWTSLGFAAGDSIHVVNQDDLNPAPEGYYRIQETHGDDALLYDTFPLPTQCRVRIKREVPNLCMAAACGNRLFGSDGTTVYIGAEASPFAFQGKQADGRGAATLQSSTPGALTACASWQGYMMFWKAGSICRVLGNRADSFALTESPAAGIPAEMARTLCEVGGELYYYGDSGVYRLASTTQKPERIAQPLNGIPVTGRAGTDGVGYYLDLAEEASDGGRLWRRCLFLPLVGKGGAWYTEEVPAVSANVLLGGFLCTQGADGRVWLSRSDGRRMGYAIHEGTLSGDMLSSVVFWPEYAFEPDRCRPVALSLRATHTEAAAGALRVVASFADGRSGKDDENPLSGNFRLSADAAGGGVPDGRVELAVFQGQMQNRLLRIPLTVPPCDHMRLGLEMVGDWQIDAVTFEYEVVKR